MTPQSKFVVAGLYIISVATAWSASHLAGISMLVIGLAFARFLDGRDRPR